MGQSLVKNYVHIIFSTKRRQPILDTKIQPELFDYLGGICKQLGCQPVKIGGHIDHIHILCLLSKNITLTTLVGEIKSNSSRWIKTKNRRYKDFFWQDGYGAFSINPTETDHVIDYVENQAEHHSNKTFQQEYQYFLEKYRVDYHERYVWD